METIDYEVYHGIFFIVIRGILGYENGARRRQEYRRSRFSSLEESLLLTHFESKLHFVNKIAKLTIKAFHSIPSYRRPHCRSRDIGRQS